MVAAFHAGNIAVALGITGLAGLIKAGAQVTDSWHGPGPVVAEAAAEALTASDFLVVTSDGVNVRFAPSEHARIRARAHRNQRVVALERQGSWVHVRVVRTGQEGWIYGSLLAPPGGEPLPLGVVAEPKADVHNGRPAVTTIGVPPEAGPEASESPTDVAAHGRTGNPPAALAQSEQEAARASERVGLARAVAEAPAAGDLLVVTGSGVNLRFEPSEDARIRTRVSRNQRVVAIERRGAWERVRIVNTGEQGWVHDSLLASSGVEPLAPPIVAASEADPSKRTPVAVATTGASAAPQAGPEAPGSPTDVAADRPAGNPPVALAQSEHEAARASEHVRLAGAVAEAPAGGDLLVVTGNGVNLRFEPSEDARIRTRLYRNQRVVAIERRGAWERVRVVNTSEEGWIHSSLLASGGKPLALPIVAAFEADPSNRAPVVAATGAPVASPAGLEAPGSPTDVATDRPAGNPPRVAQSEQQAAPTSGPAGTASPKPVGEAPPEETKPSIALQALDTGVLTPKGTLVLEPSFEFAHSSTNRFTFRGIELIEAVQIGVIEAENADRDFYQAALTARYGLSPWLEAELRVPGVYRSDKVHTSSGTPPTTEFE